MDKSDPAPWKTKIGCNHQDETGRTSAPPNGLRSFEQPIPIMKTGDSVTLEQLEIEHIRLVLESAGEKGAGAKWLGIDRSTLRKKIEKFGGASGHHC